MVSPFWYITELVFQELGFFLDEYSKVISAKGLEFFENRVKVFENEKRWVEGGHCCLGRSRNGSQNQTSCLYSQRIGPELDKERSIKDLRWVEWNWDKINEQLDTFHETMIIAQVSHLGALFTWKRPLDVPDYFGKTVVFAGEECIRCLDSNNPDLFSKLFEKYFGGIFLTFEKMRSENADLRPEHFMLLLAEPIMDVFYVSGLSLLYSELHQNPSLFEPSQACLGKIYNKEPEGLFATLGNDS